MPYILVGPKPSAAVTILGAWSPGSS